MSSASTDAHDGRGEDMVTVEFKADGTTCHSCAEIIRRQALKVDGVKSAEFDYPTEKGRLTFDQSKTDVDRIFNSIESKGYSCSVCVSGPKKTREDKEYFAVDKKTIGGIAIIIGIIIIGFFAFRLIEGINIPDITKNMSYGLLFVVGLLTGFHCIAMCGGFVVSYTAKAAQEGKPLYRSHIMYAAGKTLSYTLIGAAFGFLGSIIAFTPQLRGALAIIAGLFLMIFGLKMLGAFNFLRRFGFKQPQALAKLAARNNDKGPLVIGLLNGLMIACGPLQAVYVLAAGTGSAIEGAKLLFVFALGTLPVMLGFGYLTSFISSKATHTILRLSGIVVIVLGLIMLNNGLALSGTNLGFLSTGDNSAGTGSQADGQGQGTLPDNVAVLKEGYQEIHMTVDASGYTPSTFTLKKGVPVKWIIEVKQLTSCNKAIQVPAYNLKFDLVMGEQTIDFTPTDSGTIRWSCWMGMIQGKFIVQDELSSAAPAQAQAQAGNTPSQAAVGAPAAGGCGCGCGGSGGCVAAGAGSAGQAPAGAGSCGQ